MDTPSLLTFGTLNVGDDDSVKEFSKLVGKTVENRGLWGIVANAGILGNSGPDDWLNAQDYINVSQRKLYVVTHLLFRPCKSTLLE